MISASIMVSRDFRFTTAELTCSCIGRQVEYLGRWILEPLGFRSRISIILTHGYMSTYSMWVLNSIFIRSSLSDLIQTYIGTLPRYIRPLFDSKLYYKEIKPSRDV